MRAKVKEKNTQCVPRKGDVTMDYYIKDLEIMSEETKRDDKALSERVKALRKRMGMTQQQFGDYFEIPRRTLQDWESGKRRIPTYLLKLMEFKVNEEKKKNESEEN